MAARRGGARLVVAVTARGGHLREQTAQGVASARAGQYDEAWQHLQLRPVKRYAKPERGCARYSSGQVRQFFARTPCRSLERALLVVGTDADSIAISVAWVQMPTTSTAARLKQTLDQGGPAGIHPVSGRTLKLGDIRFTRRHYSSQQSETMVVIAEAEPIRGHPAATLLDAAAEVAVALPPLRPGVTAARLP
jgi:hypothetical protein